MTEQPPAAQGVPARVRNGSVLVVGVGGLGCPAALGLAAAGVGMIGLADADRVELSNLQRQILHFSPDVGARKVASAQRKLRALDAGLRVAAYPVHVRADNLTDLFRGYDFVIDGTDGVDTKFLLNDGAVLTGTPLSHAGVVGFQGQALTVIPGETTCLRCLFPVPPDQDETPSCQQAGILGSVAGMLGSVQAAEAVKYLSGQGALLRDRLVTCDALSGRWREVPVRRNPRCPLCGTQRTITRLHAAADAQESPARHTG